LSGGDPPGKTRDFCLLNPFIRINEWINNPENP